MAEKKGIVKGEWKGANRSIEVNLPIILFQEDEAYIAYCPALDLTGTGNNEQEAFESFNITMGEYFLYTARKKTLAEDLIKHGWVIQKSKQLTMRPPKMSKLLQTNKEFSEIFNKHPFRKIDQRVTVPSC